MDRKKEMKREPKGKMGGPTEINESWVNRKRKTPTDRFAVRRSVRIYPLPFPKWGWK